jgi:hypothetical protein
LITAASRTNTFAGHGRLDVARCPRPRDGSAGTAIQFLGAMETVNVSPRRSPQPVQHSFRSTLSSFV